MHAPAALALALLASTAAPKAAPDDPAAPVHEAYRLEQALVAAKQADAAMPWGKPHRDRLLSKRLAALFDRDERYSAATGEVGNIDGDPFLDAQDYQDDVLHDLVVDVVARHGGRAEVRARFSNLGKQLDLRFDVVREAGRWVIDDIRSGKSSVAHVLATPYACAPGWKEPCAK